MGVNHFSKEQIDELSKNPYVQRVTEKAITYTEQFREEFYLKYNHGDTPASILRSMGFNTKVLGQKRINGIVQRIKKMAEKGTFEDSREGSSGRPRTKEMTAEEEIAYLKHKIEYQKQQIDKAYLLLDVLHKQLLLNHLNISEVIFSSYRIGMIHILAS